MFLQGMHTEIIAIYWVKFLTLNLLSNSIDFILLLFVEIQFQKIAKMKQMALRILHGSFIFALVQLAPYSSLGAYRKQFKHRSTCQLRRFVFGFYFNLDHWWLLLLRMIYHMTFQRRPLLIYLHNDRAISANVFCTQVLSSDTLIEYLVNHFIVWAWDFTSETNRAQW